MRFSRSRNAQKTPKSFSCGMHQNKTKNYLATFTTIQKLEGSNPMFQFRYCSIRNTASSTPDKKTFSVMQWISYTALYSSKLSKMETANQANCKLAAQITIVVAIYTEHVVLIFGFHSMYSERQVKLDQSAGCLWTSTCYPRMWIACRIINDRRAYYWLHCRPRIRTCGIRNWLSEMDHASSRAGPEYEQRGRFFTPLRQAHPADVPLSFVHSMRTENTVKTSEHCPQNAMST